MADKRDEIDLQILRLLRDDGRMAISDLAKAVSVSRPNAYARLKELQRSGVLRGFTASVDGRGLGLGVAALVSLSVEQPARDTLQPALDDIPEVEFAAFLTGDTDAVALVRARSIEHLRDDIIWALDKHPAIRSTRTALVLSEIVNRPYALPR